MSKDRYNVTDIVPLYDINCDIKNFMLPMRDGVKLHTTVYFPPKHPAKSPVFIVRSPYSRTTELLLPHSWAMKHKVVYIFQACRGTGWSEGVFDPADRDYEMRDVEDLFFWMEKQPWYNGICAMDGGSYPGWVQWCAQRTGYKGLVATAPNVAPLAGCIGAAAEGGGVQHSFTESWMLSMHHRQTYGYSGQPDYQAMGLFEHVPVIDGDKFAGYGVNKPFRKFYEASLNPERQLHIHDKEFKLFRAPALVSGGWFDGFRNATVQGFQELKKQGATKEAREFTRMWIGPWGHGGLLNPDLFGAKNNQDELIKARQKFLFGLLKNPRKDPIPEIPTVRYFMLGENRWRDAETWPPAGEKTGHYYLHSGGGANTLYGSGTINARVPQTEPCDVFISDPAHPVTANGGKHAALGCYDRTEDEKRADVLVYSMKVEQKAVTVAGRGKLKFYASVSAPDTDIFVHLIDVTPEGKALIITTGMIRARFRNSLKKEELLTPGKVYPFTVELFPTAVNFLPGHTLRIEICGQHFPAWGRNPNTGNNWLTDTELRCASISIFHDKEHPAILELPLLDK